MKAIINGAYGESINKQLEELENKKKQLENALSIEKAKEELACNENEIQEFFNKYVNANLHDPTLRDEILEHYIEAIIVYDDEIYIEFKGDYIKTSIAGDVTGQVDLINGYLPPVVSMPIIKGTGKKKRIIKEGLKCSTAKHSAPPKQRRAKARLFALARGLGRERRSMETWHCDCQAKRRQNRLTF